MNRVVIWEKIQRQLRAVRISGVIAMVFVFALVATVSFAPAVGAQSPETPVVPPTVTETEEAPVTENEQPAEIEQPPAQSASLLQMAAMPPTNNPDLFWSWVIVQPEGQEPVEITGYGYNLFRNGELISEGTLQANQVSFLYTATQDSTYTLNVWVTPAAEAEIEHQDSQSVLYDGSGPVFKNDGIVVSGPIATPRLSTEETDVLYNWTVSGPANGAIISDAVLLNPEFTFSRDGRYTLRLTATDILGNVSMIEFTVTYVVPFVPTETAPLSPEEFTPEPIKSYVRPHEVSAAVQRTTRVATDDTIASSTISGNARNAIIAESSTTNRAQDDPAPQESTVALAASPEGWKIFGLAWYWWILIAAIIASAWLWTVRTLRLRRMS